RSRARAGPLPVVDFADLGEMRGETSTEDVLQGTFTHSRSPMSEVTRILSAIEQGDPDAAAKLLPLVYDELRHLPAQKLAHENPAQPPQAPALVQEASRPLGDAARPQQWDSRGLFSPPAAEAMRRTLTAQARRKLTKRGGGGRHRHDLEHVDI